MGILSGDPTKEPMHYGEVFSTWSFVLSTKGAVACYQVYLNHTGDQDLQKLLKEVIKEGQQEVEQIESLLKKNGIGLPPSPPDRPEADFNDIPIGARFTDPEIATTLSADIAAGLIACSTIIGQSIREDIALMFGQIHTKKALLGAKALKLNKEKGWLVPPPLHHYKSDSD